MTAATPLLPATALTALTDEPVGLIGNRRGRVVHLALLPRPERDVAPSGRVRAGRGPLCGQSGRAWRLATPVGRPLCARCAALVRQRTTPRQLLAAQTARPSAQDLADALNAATSMATVDAVVGMLARSNAGLLRERVIGAYGRRTDLGGALQGARARLSPPTARRRAS